MSGTKLLRKLFNYYYYYYYYYSSVCVQSSNYLISVFLDAFYEYHHYHTPTTPQHIPPHQRSSWCQNVQCTSLV